MTDRLNNPEGQKVRIAAPAEEAERRRFWIERGNRILWGQEPTSKGDFLPARPDLEWAWSNGSYFIQPRFSRG